MLVPYIETYNNLKI